MIQRSTILSIGINTTIFLFFPCFSAVVAQVSGFPPPRSFNAILLNNAKSDDVTCCMNAIEPMKDSSSFGCLDQQVYDPNALCSNGFNTCASSLSISQVFCAVKPRQKQDSTGSEFEEKCKQSGGEVTQKVGGRCSFDNYNTNFKWPSGKEGVGGPPPPTPPLSSPPPSANPKGSSAKNKPPSNKDGESSPFSNSNSQTVFNYALVDFSVTQAFGCCRMSQAPIVSFDLYNCTSTDQLSDQVFKEQCAIVLMGEKSIDTSQFHSLGGSPNSLIVDDATNQICEQMWYNLDSFSYGYCQIKFDQAAFDSLNTFLDDCKTQGGSSIEPHLGQCMWDIDNSAGNSARQDGTHTWNS